MSTGPLLIIWHSRTGTSEQLAAAACEGAGEGAQLLRACDTAPDDLLAAGGYLFCCPENLASMSGEMKEMFDRCYYPVRGRIEGRSYATVIAAGSDGEGAQRQLDRIATGWRLKRVTDPWIVKTDAQEPEEILAPKTVSDSERACAAELGAALAEGIAQGIF
jgi:multimeric flavodoxin WrbA